MNHAPIVPIVLPALVAALMLLDRRIATQRMLAWVSVALLAGCAAWMLGLAADGWRGLDSRRRNHLRRQHGAFVFWLFAARPGILQLDDAGRVS